MPTYEYICTTCDTKTDLFRTISRRNDPAECSSCGDEATRGIEVPERVHHGLPGQGQGVKYGDGWGMSTNTKLGKPRGPVST